MLLLFPQVNGQIAGYVLVSAMVATFGFGVFAGLKLIEDEARGLRLLRWYFGLQMPILSSPLIAYQLSSGAGINLSMIGSNLSAFWRFGSEMGVSLFQDRPWGIGVNIFAVAMFIWCDRIVKRGGCRRPPSTDAASVQTVGGETATVSPAAERPN